MLPSGATSLPSASAPTSPPVSVSSRLSLCKVRDAHRSLIYLPQWNHAVRTLEDAVAHAQNKLREYECNSATEDAAARLPPHQPHAGLAYRYSGPSPLAAVLDPLWCTRVVQPVIQHWLDALDDLVLPVVQAECQRKLEEMQQASRANAAATDAEAATAAAGSDRSSNAQSEFQQYCALFVSPTPPGSSGPRKQHTPWLKSLLSEYPYLKALIDKMLTNAAHNVAQALTRMEQDTEIILKHTTRLGWDRKESSSSSSSSCGVSAASSRLGLRLIHPTGSDGHCGGLGVLLLEFNNGHKLVYKPFGATNARLFQQFVHILQEETIFRSGGDEANQRDKIRCMQVVIPAEERAVASGSTTTVDASSVASLHQSYGWCEFLDSSVSECQSVSEVHQFYFRAGLLSAIATGLSFNDAHYENIIAVGAQPVIIDTETFFQPVEMESEDRDQPQPITPPSSASGPRPASEVSHRHLRRLLSSLLIQRCPTPFSMSGSTWLAAFQHHPYRAPDTHSYEVHHERSLRLTINYNAIVNSAEPARICASMPRYKGEPRFLCDSATHFINGYQLGHRALHQLGQLYVTNSQVHHKISVWYASVCASVNRVVIRPTRFYVFCLRLLQCESAYRGFEAATRVLEPVLEESNSFGFDPAIRKAEIQDLINFDVPAFYYVTKYGDSKTNTDNALASPSTQHSDAYLPFTQLFSATGELLPSPGYLLSSVHFDVRHIWMDSSPHLTESVQSTKELTSFLVADPSDDIRIDPYSYVECALAMAQASFAQMQLTKPTLHTDPLGPIAPASGMDADLASSCVSCSSSTSSSPPSVSRGLPPVPVEWRARSLYSGLSGFILLFSGVVSLTAQASLAMKQFTPALNEMVEYLLGQHGLRNTDDGHMEIQDQSGRKQRLQQLIATDKNPCAAPAPDPSYTSCGVYAGALSDAYALLLSGRVLSNWLFVWHGTLMALAATRPDMIASRYHDWDIVSGLAGGIVVLMEFHTTIKGAIEADHTANNIEYFRVEFGQCCSLLSDRIDLCISKLLSLGRVHPLSDGSTICLWSNPLFGGDHDPSIQSNNPLFAALACIPVTGMAHGYAGLAYCWERVATFKNDPQYHALAMQLISVEDCLYDPLINNWYDTRKLNIRVYPKHVRKQLAAGVSFGSALSVSPAPLSECEMLAGHPSGLLGWCYGSVGIVLGRCASPATRASLGGLNPIALMCKTLKHFCKLIEPVPKAAKRAISETEADEAATAPPSAGPPAASIHALSELMKQCCGAVGAIDVSLSLLSMDLSASELPDAAPLRTAVADLAALLIHRLNKFGAGSLFPLGDPTRCGMMLGAQGLAWVMLRLHSPNKFPSILAVLH